MEEKKQHISDWLEDLQRESWNLELLVSGFSIFLLLQSHTLVTDAFQYLNLHVQLSRQIENIARSLVITFWFISVVLIFNLILHVLIRGFWIGAVGLRSVQQSIDFEKLNYGDFFTEKLKEKVPPLDVMIRRLDTLASIIFSFAFLIAFMFFSFFLFFSILAILNHPIIWIQQSGIENETLKMIVIWASRISMIIWIFFGFIYMIDTLSLGFFKKFKWLSKIYYPIYVVMGIFTLAGLYRSIYYSLISRFSKQKIRLILVPYLFLIFLFPFQKFDQYIFYPDNNDDYSISNRAYDDIRTDDVFISTASIPSKVIEDSFLPLFIRYNVSHNVQLRNFCNDIEILKDDGWNSGIYFHKGGLKMGDPVVNEKEPERFLECLSDYYSIYLDSVKVEAEMFFYTHPNKNERGIQTLLDIVHLERGKHEILIKRKYWGWDEDKLEWNKDELEDSNYTRVPFWKE